jgi:hypothetical protein
MYFLSIVDDFYLQGILANLKCKDYWNKNYPNDLYENDWFAALLIHSFSWSFMMHLPISYLMYIDNFNKDIYGLCFIFSIILNMSIHTVIDYLKCNLKQINLCNDQMFHLVQVFITWVFWLIVMM